MRTAAVLATLLLAAPAWTAGARRDPAPLSVEAVTALCQDREGYLWIGSREGLSLFDGYTATVFEHDAADPFSLSDNAIRTIFEDREGRLWVGTNAGGLNVLDRATGRFRAYRYDSSDRRSIPNDSVHAIAQDRQGALWVATQGGLARLDPRTGAFEARATTRPYVDALVIDDPGTVWAGTIGGGLNTFADGSASGVMLGPAGDVYALAIDPRGELWEGGPGGVSRVDRETGARTPIFFDGAEDVLTTSIAAAADGTIWAGTFDHGLWALRPGAGLFRREPMRGIADLAPADRVIDVLVDAAGTTWAGTWGGGLTRAASRSGLLRTFDAGEGESTAVHEDRAGNVWVGLTNEVVRRDPAGATRAYPLPGAALWFREQPDGTMLIGTSAGLEEVHPASGATRAVPLGESGTGWIWAAADDGAGGLYVATGGGGLYRRTLGGELTRFRHDASDPKSLSDDYVVALLRGRDGALWVGTRSGGLNVLRAPAREFERFAPSDADPGSLAHHSVTSLLQDRTGTIWIGTGGAGVDRIAAGTAGPVRFEHLTEADGLIDDNVVSLAEDADGSVWIGTRRGLSRFDPVSKTFANYGTDDGLPSAEFANGAAAAGKSTLYFATHRGVVTVPRGTPFPKHHPSPTVLTDVGGHEGRPEKVELAYGAPLSFEIAVLDFGDRRRHRYAYRLDGLSKDWIPLGTSRDVTLTHLPPGHYTLRVRGRNGQGVWSEAAGALPLRVVPPFWMTAWFKALAAAALLGTVVAGHRLRTAALERTNRQLVVLKDERESALDEARASQSELNRAYERLRGLTRRLEAAKEEERKRIARELHDEMGQILTTAKLNLQLLPGTPGPEERARRVGDAIGLLDRLIGHVRALSLDLRPPLLDELGLAAALRGYTEALARRAGIAIDVACDAVPRTIPADVEIAGFRVIQEALTNVLRHAGAKQVAVVVRYDPGRLDLSVSDDGGGFDVAAALERATDGAHLGLLGMKERVESMGGAITIASTPGTGAIVRAHIPWAV